MLRRSKCVWDVLVPPIRESPLKIPSLASAISIQSRQKTITLTPSKHHQKMGNRLGYRPRVGLRYYSIQAGALGRLEDNILLQHPRYLEVKSLLGDEILKQRYLIAIRAAQHIDLANREILIGKFKHLVDIANGFSGEEPLAFLVDIWTSVFENESQDESILDLQKKLMGLKSRLIHLLMNTRSFPVYLKSIEPLYNIDRFSGFMDWSDILIKTMQYGIDNHGDLTVNKASILRFLKDHNTPIEQKRRLISIFLRKGLLYRRNDNEYDFVVRCFVEFVNEIGDGHLLFLDPEYSLYLKLLELLATPPKNMGFSDHINHLKEVLGSRFGSSPDIVLNLISSFMACIAEHNPKGVLSLWKTKQTILEEADLTVLDTYNYFDLKTTMSSLCNLQLYQSCLDLYQKFPELHHEDQIEILLRVSEKSKNLTHLQKQFEDMYGQGQLPYVVHYAIVMNVLASIGAVEEVEQLYFQLKKRNLNPNENIYAALINAHVYYDNIEEAKRWLNAYLKDDKKDVKSSSTAYLYSLLFKVYLKQNDIGSSMEMLYEILHEQEESKAKLVDANIIVDIINTASTSYGLKEIEELRQITYRLGLNSMKFYENLIRAYTRLDQFEKAEDVIYEAHLESFVPFTDASIYKVQLRNYRFWHRSSTKLFRATFIYERLDFIRLLTFNTDSRIHLTAGFLNELIKLYLIQGENSKAWDCFDEAKELGMLSEHFYIPFLKHYANKNTFADYSKVLEIYKEMAKENFNISTKTYAHLIKALIYLDGLNNNGYENSFKLLLSVLELNGFSFGTDKPEVKSNVNDIHRNSIDLCQMVTYYISACPWKQENMDFLVRFLNQMREKLNRNMSIDFKFSIYKEMSRLYLKQGNTELAVKLISGGIADLQKLIDNYISNYPYDTSFLGEVIVPKNLQVEYRTLLNLKIRSLGDCFDDPELAHDFLVTSNRLGVNLSGSQYVFIIKKIMRSLNPKYFRTVLQVCEDNLVSGNWAEVVFHRRLQYLYKVTLNYLVQRMGVDTTMKNFAILNEFYNIKNISDLQNLQHIASFTEVLEKELKDFTLLYSTTIRKDIATSVSELLLNLAEFFCPEVRLPTQNKIPPYLTEQLWLAFDKYCDLDLQRAYDLMDEYPDTIEFLHYNNTSRIRYKSFRKKIDSIKPPPESERGEDFYSRRRRTIETLSELIHL